MSKLTKAEQRLLEMLASGDLLGLTGISSIIAAQGLIDKGLAKTALMGMVEITDAGRAVIQAWESAK